MTDRFMKASEVILSSPTDEFARAVKICTGAPMNEHLIDTVFAIFDEDGDGKAPQVSLNS